MKNILFFLFLFIFISPIGCVIEQKLPADGIILDQVIFVDEVKNGVPQTLLMPNGTTVTYKMPEKLYDGQIIKVRDIPGERPYFIKINLQNRDEQKKK